jgi:hypothetical protein
MVSKDVFLKMCDAFSESLTVYKEVDNLIEHSYRAREYFNKAIKPIMRVCVNDIAGKETLDSILYEDDWGRDYLYDMVMRVVEDYFDNDAQTVLVHKENTLKGQCYVPFGDVYTPSVIYEWLIHMDKDDKKTWDLPVGPVESGYDVIKHYVAQGIEF